MLSALKKYLSIDGYAPDRAVGWWLVICALMVVLMVAVGGMTRLTGSGLSMVEWKPVTGFIPPLSEEAWMLLFNAYKESPEYQKVNFGMSVYEFRQIFWLEFIHRLIGRLTGFIFLVPLVYFFIRQRLSRAFMLRYGGIFLLGGVQGLVGWYMVKSGLVDDPWVSPYRLMMHFMLALAIFALLVWHALLHLRGRPSSGNLPLAGKRLCEDTPPPQPSPGPCEARLRHDGREGVRIRRLLMAMGILFVVQVMYGAFVAGLDAGFIYNDFPTMAEGRFFPDDPWKISPLPLNLTENIAVVQFIHRWLGFAVLGLALALFINTRAAGENNRGLTSACELLLIVVMMQVALGISTLVMVVPLDVAVLHQVTATGIAAILVFLFYDARNLCGRTKTPT